MCDEDVGDDLEGDGLEGWVPFGEAVEEEGEVLFGEVLWILSAIFHRTPSYSKHHLEKNTRLTFPSKQQSPKQSSPLSRIGAS